MLHVGLYLYTLKISHKYCNMFSIQNKLILQKKWQNIVTNNEGDTPLLVRSIHGGDLDGTPYAKGLYAVRRNSVIS